MLNKQGGKRVRQRGENENDRDSLQLRRHCGAVEGARECTAQDGRAGRVVTVREHAAVWMMSKRHPKASPDDFLKICIFGWHQL